MRAAFAGMLMVVGTTVVACASAPPPPPAAGPAQEDHEVAVEEPAPMATVSLGAPERSQPPSTKTYDDALSTPEKLDVHDDRVQLTDGQLTGPMRAALNGCRVPSNGRVTIKTAVQNGRAIGVTVMVRYDHGKSTKPPPRAVLRAEAKMTAKIVACADRNVRAVTWPPSARRDSFTTEF